MSGILRLESLTKGNTLKQGDKTPLKYRLFDADGEKLNIAGKPAKVRLVYPDFLTIGYEKGGLTVAQDDTVTFTIDSVIPSRIYHVEIIVDDKFIFPSRADESKFTVDKSSLGTEANIIEIIGVDAVVRKAVDLINEDPNLIIDEDKLVNDIISNTGIGSIDEYYQQFSDVITELSEEKDYHSLPEIAGARGGFDTLGDRLNDTSNQLVKKADQAFVDSQLSSIVSGTPKGTYANLTALQNAYPSGADGIFLVLENGHWYYWNTFNSSWSDGGVYQSTGLGEGEVEPINTTFFNNSPNLFNPDNVVIGKNINSQGNIVDSSNQWYFNDYIPVKQGDKVNITPGVYAVILYDGDKGFIGRTGTNTDGTYTVTSSVGRFFTIIGFTSVDISQIMLNLGDELLPFQPYGSSLYTKYLPNLESYESFNDLKTNIGTTDTKLLDLETRVSEIHDNISGSEGANLLRIDAAKDFTFLLDIRNNEYAGHRFRKDDAEDFIKKYEESIYGEGTVIKYENYDYINNDLSGSHESNVLSNHYATRVGTIINHQFTGSKITLRHIVRYDGGLWKASIDGNFVKNISSHRAASGVTQAETLIADNLSEGSHTLTLEFMGIDPESPATTSDLVTPNANPRGWITIDLGDTPDKATFKVESQLGGIAKKFDITSGFSNKEFAFEVESVQGEGSEWFPSHFGIPTTNKGDSGFQYLLLDGKEIDIDTPSSNLIPFSKAQFVQVLESKRTEDTEARAKIKLIMTIEGTKIKQSFEIEFLQDTFIRNAYAFMIPTLNTFLGQMTTDRSERLLANTTDLGTSTYADNVNVSRIIATSNNEEMKDYYLRVDLTQDDLVINNLYLQHRSDGIHQKLYLKTHSQHEALAGDIFQVEGTWEVNRLKNANAVYG